MPPPSELFCSGSLKPSRFPLPSKMPKMIAPSLISLELTNVCLKKIRRHPDQRESIREAFRLYFRLNFEMVHPDCMSVMDLAERSGLTAYDASYLWVARWLGSDLVTLDKALENAFRSIG